MTMKLGLRSIPASLVPIALTCAVACGSSSSDQCKVGADCASGACSVDGRCVAPQQADGGASDGGAASDAASHNDAAITDTGGEAAAGGCIANNDGVIDRSEVIIEPGLHAKFRVATNATWSTAGTSHPDGTWSWDLSGALANDKDVEMDTLSVKGAWYESQFAGAAYAAQLSATATLLGVFQSSAASIALTGVVSPQDGQQKTELSYSPSVPSLQFPMRVGDSWTTNAQVTGTAQGVPAAYSESYSTKIDARGDLKTPYGSFAVQRVAVVLTRVVGALVTVTRSYVFVAECFGPIATVVSQSNETNAEFTSVAEARRLAP